MRPTLTVAYSCLADRVGNLRPPPSHDDVEFVVCVQGSPASAPDWAHLVVVEGLGVARSRNAAIDAATGQFLLFCDDDVAVDLDGVRVGRGIIERSGDALALGRGLDPDGDPRKPYPSKVTKLTRFNSARAATYEMLVDVDQIRGAAVRFDERFGAGAALYLADEYIFITDMLAAGLTAVSVPEVFGTHPAVSSGDHWGSRLDAHVRAVAINRVFGRNAPIARIAFAAKHARHLGGWRDVLAFATNGSRPTDDRPRQRRADG